MNGPSTSGVAILIPVKSLSNAKQRLAVVLDQPSRTQLAQAMLQDVVAAIAFWKARPPCVLVTSDPFARNLATQYDFEVIADLENAGETAAIAMATQVCVNRAVQTTLVIPADIPLIHSSELEQILTHAPEAGSVLVPAADGRGSNAILRRPADLFPLRFGNESFKPHLAAARATGKTCEVLHLSGIALDVDNPEDLRELLSHPGATLTQSLLGRWVAEGRLTIPLQDCD